MDKHSWPWKKKSSEKKSTNADASLSDKGGKQEVQDNTKTGDYVQISVESYAHLSKLEDHVKALNEKLSSSQSEMTAKDEIVKQHAKVAEEAIAGWEKAEEETLALKNQLESVTLLKLTAEDRASHLNNALKECMKQIPKVKEEGEQKLHDTIFAKTRQWEKVKLELEEKIADFEQEYLRSSAENDALSRSLQEHSNALARISDEKAQADAMIEALKSDIQSCEHEINSLKYEVHVVSKELEIRNEEKNMSVKLAESANKQRIEDVKKITKLEAECQRLRGLMRKKLPGPAALAQMKLEVENLGRDYGDVRARTSARNSNPYLSPPNFSLENIQQCYKENEFLTGRLLAMEEETKMLQEVLSKRNSELQASRNISATMASKVRSLEEHTPLVNQQKSQSNSSAIAMSEDGIDEEGSCSESCSATLVSESSPFKKDRNVGRHNKTDSSKQMELMDDFLEMEKLACLPNENSDDTSLDNVQMSGDKSQQSKKNDGLLLKLQSEITSLFETRVLESDGGKLLEDIRRIVIDTQDELNHPATFCNEDTHSVITHCEQEQCPEDMEEAAHNGITVKQDGILYTKSKQAIEEELKNAISNIHDFFIRLCKEAVDIEGRSNDDHALTKKIEDFSSSFNKAIYGELKLDDFIFALSQMLFESREIRFGVMSGKVGEGESNGNDFIDKLTLLENRVAQHEPTKAKLAEESVILSHSKLDPATFSGPSAPGCELKTMSHNCNLEEFEQMKQEKDHITRELAKCTETLDQAKIQLVDMEQQLADQKSQLAACQRSNSLSETQLKCMAESYKSLESRTQELETEINLLHSKAEALDNELQNEKHSHQDDLAKYEELQQEIERGMRCSICSSHSTVDVDIKTKQEREIAAAAEKLAECQESIFLLGRQLKEMQPPSDLIGSSPTGMLRIGNGFLEGKRNAGGHNPEGTITSEQSGGTSTDNDDAASVIQRIGEDESYSDGYNSLFHSYDMESTIPNPRTDSNTKRAKHRSKSASTSSLANVVNDKQSRGFSRFFSKMKSDH